MYSHRAFAESLGVITFPLLADFHPKGEVAKNYGLWREERGTSRRAVVIVDPAGVVQWLHVIPQGPPELEELLGAVRAVAGRYA